MSAQSSSRVMSEPAASCAAHSKIVAPVRVESVGSWNDLQAVTMARSTSRASCGSRVVTVSTTLNTRPGAMAILMFSAAKSFNHSAPRLPGVPGGAEMLIPARPPVTQRAGIVNCWYALAWAPKKGEASAVWPRFRDLVDYRDGVVRRGASRPDGGPLSAVTRPDPPLDGLRLLPAGWVADIVRDLIVELNTAAGTPGAGLVVNLISCCLRRTAVVHQ